ncbi:MAG: Acyl-CoA dehydrogenase [Pseudonocardiales bacterium]|nr:Acyl-CoA dehydrogenase [Pseudonocardiales bacterium]
MTTEAESVADRAALRSAVRELLDDTSAPARVREVADKHHSFDEKLWSQLVDMGVIELASPQNRISAGASHLDLVVVFEELGRALAPVPALSAAAALSVFDGSTAESQGPEIGQWLEDLLTGKRRAAVAVDFDDDLQPVSPSLQATTSQSVSDPGITLTGTLSAVPDVVGADLLLVLADTTDGLGLYAIATDAAGVEITPTQSFDLSRPLADVVLTGASAVAIGQPGEGRARIDRLVRTIWLLLAAEQVGVAQRALDEAVAYAKIRHQFGRAIGSFQAIKHSCVEMLIKVEGSRGLVGAAAIAMDADDDQDAALQVSLAAAYANEAATDCADRCLQIHGGIGYTWEHIAHLIMRKARSGSVLFGPAGSHWQLVTKALSRRAEAGLE